MELSLSKFILLNLLVFILMNIQLGMNTFNKSLPNYQKMSEF